MPSHLFIGGILVLGAVGAYELVTKIGKKKTGDGGDADVDTSVPASTGVASRPGAPGTGKRPSGAPTGKDPRFLAAHPQWQGWSPGAPRPLPNKPPPPVLRSAAMRAATTTPIVGGLPVMSGNPAKDLAAILAWHGAASVDKGLVRRFQQSAGLEADGKFGPQTAAALATALQALGIPMPNVAPASRQGVAPPRMAPAAPDHNITG